MTKQNTTWTVDGSGEHVDHEPSTKTSTTSTTGYSGEYSPTDPVAALNRETAQISLDQFLMTMSRLEIFDSESYDEWFRSIGKWNAFPAFPATEFGIDEIWKQVQITRGYLRLLSALQRPLSDFD
jgi:hypothetical protein